MTGEEWATFCQRHSELFALNTDADLVMLRAWRPLIGHFALAEVLEASSFLTGLEQASRKREHVGLLKARIYARRRDTEKQWDDAGWKEPGPDCSQSCYNGGHFVPHPKSVQDGAWVPPYYTCFVYCSCPFGQRKREPMWRAYQDSNGKMPKPLDLNEYEGRVPNWRELLLERENQHQDQQRERVFSEEADKAKGIDLAEARRRLAQSFKMPKE